MFRQEYGYSSTSALTLAANQQASHSSLRSALFSTAALDTGAMNFDEVDRFCQVILPSDSNIIAWFQSQKSVFPVHFLAAEKHSITASSTAVERANSEAAREFTKFRLSLSEPMFRISMCTRSWKRILRVPDNRREAADGLNAELVAMMEDINLSNEWEEECIEEGVINYVV